MEGDSSGLNIVNINPEPIGIFTLPLEKHLKYKEILQSIWINAPEDLKQQFDSEPYTKHLCNSSNQNLFKSFDQLRELKSDVQSILLDYIKQIGYICEDIVINSAWLNNAQKNAKLISHMHSNAFLSATYYINFDPEIHSTLTFRNDRLSQKRNPGFPILDIPMSEETTIYTSENVGLTTKEGQIFVWRSHQSHGYYTPNKASNRLTLSLNAIPKTLDNGSYKFTILE